MNDITEIATPGVYWLAILPVICVAVAGLSIVLGRALTRNEEGVLALSYMTAYLGLIAAAASLVVQWQDIDDSATGEGYVAFSRMIVIDKFSIFLGMVVIISAALGAALAAPYLKHVHGSEYLALLLFAVVGMLAIITANDLIVVFVALEVLSIPLYILTAFTRGRLNSQEAGLKYFVLGALSSAIFLYGVALTYGATGTTSLTGVAQYMSSSYLLESGTLLAGMLLIVAGLAFKISAVPFHMWTPDAYQGAPTPVTAFMAAATKAAAFGALIRVLAIPFSSSSSDWRPVVWLLAVLSMVVGAAIALAQSDVKRMLAYSSIAHAGYILIGVQADTTRGVSASIQYLAIYAVMVIGSFAALYVLAGNDEDKMSLRDLHGAARSNPLAAGFLAFFVLAQAGVPFTGGFVAKLSVFAAGIDARQYALVIVGVLSAVLAAAFYLRIVFALFGEPEVPQEEAATPAPESAGEGAVAILVGEALEVDRVQRLVQASVWAAIVVAAVLTLLTGIVPNVLGDLANYATLL